MTYGLLQCDHVDDHNRHLAGDYNDMFADLLPGDWRVYDLTAGDFPEPRECDAWVVTGSHYSVYDDVPWIHQFKQLVRSIDAAGVPLLGVCFDHQMMAHALGGRTAKCPRGWGVGVHHFRVHTPEPWMQPPLDTVSLLMSCQDQVEVLPPGAVVLASSDHCPVAIYRCRAMLGVQGHPEWQPPYSRALIEQRTPRLGPELSAQALSSLDQPRHAAEFAAWTRAWFRLHGVA